MRLASLPWYDVKNARAALDRFWSVLAEELSERGATGFDAGLDRETPLVEQWSRPDLVISQCCGSDLFTPAAARLEPFARPVFSDLDCSPGSYFSRIVAAEGRTATPRCVAVNAPSSHSGCAVLVEWTAARGWTDLDVRISGSHEESLELVRSGAADLAAIDAHSWTLLDPSGIRRLGRTPDAPAPPFVRHRECPIPAGVVREALARAIERAGDLVGIRGLLPADRATYAAMRADPESLSRYRSRCGVSCGSASTI